MHFFWAAEQPKCLDLYHQLCWCECDFRLDWRFFVWIDHLSATPYFSRLMGHKESWCNYLDGPAEDTAGVRNTQDTKEFLLPVLIIYSRGLQACFWGPTILKCLATTLIKHTCSTQSSSSRSRSEINFPEEWVSRSRVEDLWFTASVLVCCSDLPNVIYTSAFNCFFIKYSFFL